MDYEGTEVDIRLAQYATEAGGQLLVLPLSSTIQSSSLANRSYEITVTQSSRTNLSCPQK